MLSKIFKKLIKSVVSFPWRQYFVKEKLVIAALAMLLIKSLWSLRATSLTFSANCLAIVQLIEDGNAS